MTNDIKTKILNDLDESAAKIVDTILVLSSQGYLVNNAKFINLNNLVLAERLFIEHDTFSDNIKKELLSVYNLL